jgi:hypothetical protein
MVADRSEVNGNRLVWFDGLPTKAGTYSFKTINNNGTTVNRRLYFDGLGCKYSEDVKNYTRSEVISHGIRRKNITRIKSDGRCPKCGSALRQYEYTAVCECEGCDYCERKED